MRMSYAMLLRKNKYDSLSYAFVMVFFRKNILGDFMETKTVDKSTP